MLKCCSESQDIIRNSFGCLETDSIFLFLNSVSELTYGKECVKGILEFCNGEDFLNYIGGMFEFSLNNTYENSFSASVLLAYIYQKVHNVVVGKDKTTITSERCNAILRYWECKEKNFDFVLPISNPTPL